MSRVNTAVNTAERLQRRPKQQPQLMPHITSPPCHELAHAGIAEDPDAATVLQANCQKVAPE